MPSYVELVEDTRDSLDDQLLSFVCPYAFVPWDQLHVFKLCILELEALGVKDLYGQVEIPAFFDEPTSFKNDFVNVGHKHCGIG